MLLWQTYGAPEHQHRRERDQPEQRPRQEIQAVGQVVLNPDVDDVPVFLHRVSGPAQPSARVFVCEGRI